MGLLPGHLPEHAREDFALCLQLLMQSLGASGFCLQRMCSILWQDRRPQDAGEVHGQGHSPAF